MTSLAFDEVKEILKNENEEFARVYRKHREMDERVTVLEQQPHLTIEEEVEETQLKVDKLHLKDKMAEMIKQYQASH